MHEVFSDYYTSPKKLGGKKKEMLMAAKKRVGWKSTEQT